MITIPFITILLAATTSAINFFAPTRTVQQEQGYIYHIPGTIIPRMTMGYERMGATLLWFKFISDFGSKDIDEIDYNRMANQLTTVITLNPFAEAAYRTAATRIPWETGNTKLSKPILLQAILGMPNDWRWHYYRGFNAYWFDHNMPQAAYHLALAAKTPHAPTSVAYLASKMVSKANNLDAAILFLQQLQRDKQQDEESRKRIQQRILAIQTEKVLRHLDQKLASIPDWHGNIATLQTYGITLPAQLPDGGDVIFDTQHQPVSSLQKKRFKIFTPHRRNINRE